METVNILSQDIHKGSHVRYAGTGSAGEVLDIKKDNEGIWAKIDSTELWYNSRYLEVIDKDHYEKIKRKRTRMPKEKEDEGKDHVKKVINLKKKLEEVDMSSELCDGGG